MKIKVLLLVLALSITSCGGAKYAVKHSSDDQFADKSGPVLITLEENYIDFKDPMGIVPSSQLVPYLFRDNDGNITEMGFHLTNVRSNEKWLNIRKGNEIVFLVDGKRISAKASNTKIDHYTSGYNSVTRSVITYYYDYAWYGLTKEQMETVCNSTDIKIKIIGNDGIEEYGTGKRGFSMNESFYSHNKKFFNEEILGRK
jgi:hypothetical protein